MTKRILTGINIQFPISQKIMSGEKTIETRTYPLPKKHIGKDLVLIETPGRGNKFKARMVAIVRFGESYQYDSKNQFYKDQPRHCVDKDSRWAWKDEKPKWAWPVLSIQPIDPAIEAPPRKGIIYTKALKLRLPT